MIVPAALRELEKIEMGRRNNGQYRLDHAVTKTEAMRMARNKTITSIDSEITKNKGDACTKAKIRYDSMVKELKTLMDKKREMQSKEIMTAFIKCGKSCSEIMNFLDFRGK